MGLKKVAISVVIIAGNEENMILGCLKSVSWAKEVILVAANSSDSTVSIAKSFRSDLIIKKTTDSYNKNFSKWRNLGSRQASYPWIFHLDADERVTPQLKVDITAIVNGPTIHTHFTIPRANFFLGQRVRFGGTYPDHVVRIFKKSNFSGHTGFLHEQPQVSGTLGYLKSDLLHFTHRSLSSMLTKTIAWTDMEAQHLLNSQHPPVYWWRFPRMLLTKLWQRLVLGQFWRDGVVGFISAIFETYDTFIIYARLYELQQKKS